MATTTTTGCTACSQDLTTQERVRYFPRQLLTANDMRAEQEYFREKQRRHNRFLHGWGVVCGMEVVAPQTGEPDSQVTVCPGLVLSPQGDEVVCSEKLIFDVTTGLQQPEPCAMRWPCPPAATVPASTEATKAYLAIRFLECSSRPVRVQVAGCACDESACEYSRVRDSFELRLLKTLPPSHQQMKEFYTAWCTTWKKWKAQTKPFPLPVSPCPPCADDPWVVLATITVPNTKNPRILNNMISFSDRLPLFGTLNQQIVGVCK